MQIKKIAQGVFAGAIIASSSALIVLSPANAGNSQYCVSAWVCVYKNSDFAIPLGYRPAGFARVNISAANDNEVSSWENRTSRDGRWYTERDGKGQCHTMTSFGELAFMNPFTQNDQMSSWAGNGGC